jgi:hypothetical protein
MRDVAGSDLLGGIEAGLCIVAVGQQEVAAVAGGFGELILRHRALRCCVRRGGEHGERSRAGRNGPSGGTFHDIPHVFSLPGLRTTLLGR